MYYFVLNKSPFSGGGVEQVVRNILDNIKVDHKQIKVICNDDGRPHSFWYKGIECINLRTASNHFMDLMFLYSQLKYAKKVFLYLSSNIKAGDLINVHGYEYAYYLGQLKCRVILTAHGSGFDMIRTYLRNLPWKMWHHKLLGIIPTIWTYFIEKQSVQAVDEIISINNYTKKKLINLYGLKTKHHVIYNGLNRTILSVTKNTSKSTGPIALIVGSSIYRKGLDIAIEAVEQYNQKNKASLILKIVGFDGYVPSRNTKYIKYIGRVPPKKIKEYYLRSDFLLFPTRWEGFPMVILEAIQFRLPFITSIYSHADEITDHKKYGLIVKNLKSLDYVNAISVMLKNHDSYKKNLIKAEMSDYDWGKISRQYYKLMTR
jgi:glycosyltransferase involved in cell wall biosynthesis